MKWVWHITMWWQTNKTKYTSTYLSLICIHQISSWPRFFIKMWQHPGYTKESIVDNKSQQIFTNRQTKQFIFSNPQHLKNQKTLVSFWKVGRLGKLQPPLTNPVKEILWGTIQSQWNLIRDVMEGYKALRHFLCVCVSGGLEAFGLGLIKWYDDGRRI